MELAISHPWDLSTEEAKALQPQLAKKVIPETTFDPAAVRTVAGIDVGFRDGVARAAVVVLSFPDLEPVDYALGRAPVAMRSPISLVRSRTDISMTARIPMPPTKSDIAATPAIKAVKDALVSASAWSAINWF